MIALTSDHIAAFDRDGFVAVENALDMATVEAARNRFEPMFSGKFETGLYPDEWNWRLGKDRPDVTRQICNGWKSDRTVASIVLRADVGKACAQLRRWPGARMCQDNVIWKPPGTKPLGFHQDDSYQLWLEPPEMVTCWIALDDTRADQGTIEHLAGSHRWPVAPPIKQFHAPDDPLEDARRAAAAAGIADIDKVIVPIVVKAGTAVFHHGRTWHGSRDNRGTNPAPQRHFPLHLGGGPLPPGKHQLHLQPLQEGRFARTRRELLSDHVARRRLSNRLDRYLHRWRADRRMSGPEVSTATLRLLQPYPHVLAFYDGRIDGKRLIGDAPNWLDDGAYSLGVATYAIFDGDAAIVYDTHVSLAHARAIRAALTERGVRDIRVVLSHWHLDHVAGNAAFADCEIIAHRWTREALIANRQAIESGSCDGLPAITPLVLPTTVYDDTLSIALGGIDVELHHFDIHSRDATVLRLPADGLLLAGDTLEDTVTYVSEPAGLADPPRRVATARQPRLRPHPAEPRRPRGDRRRRLSAYADPRHPAVPPHPVANAGRAGLAGPAACSS